jgi:hypothetical protein
MFGAVMDLAVSTPSHVIYIYIDAFLVGDESQKKKSHRKHVQTSSRSVVWKCKMPVPHIHHQIKFLILYYPCKNANYYCIPSCYIPLSGVLRAHAASNFCGHCVTLLLFCSVIHMAYPFSKPPLAPLWLQNIVGHNFCCKHITQNIHGHFSATWQCIVYMKSTNLLF